jgi:hypothetical protein
LLILTTIKQLLFFKAADRDFNSFTGVTAAAGTRLAKNKKFILREIFYTANINLMHVIFYYY